jgi:hypothetical protein
MNNQVYTFIYRQIQVMKNIFDLQIVNCILSFKNRIEIHTIIVFTLSK